MSLKDIKTPSVLVFFLSLVSATVARPIFTKDAQNHTLFSHFHRASGEFDDGICAALIEKWGYECEEHKVTTADGYILSMQRIPASRSGSKPQKPPVLLQHGLFMDAYTWLLNTPDQALAFILADNGHDVWLSNFRGTEYSRGHTFLSPYDPRYWDWSWDELAEYDLASTVEYVYRETGKKLHYVGHSLGTLVAFAALSNNKLVPMLRSAALLSPIAYMNQEPSPLTQGAALAFLAEEVYWLGLRETNPKVPVFTELLRSVCGNLGIDCTNLMTPFTGQNCCLNSSVIDPFLDYELQPTSTKNIIHLSQMIRRGTIAKFDYVIPILNLARYGQLTPPEYDMTSIPNDFPLYLSYGGRDLLSDPNDVRALVDTLRDHESDKLKVQFVEEYAHADFVFAVNANQIVYSPLMDFFQCN